THTSERLRVDSRTAAMLGRVLAAELVRRSLENADVRDLLRRRRVSRRQRARTDGAAARLPAAARAEDRRRRGRPRCGRPGRAEVAPPTGAACCLSAGEGTRTLTSP